MRTKLIRNLPPKTKKNNILIKTIEFCVSISKIN